MSGAVTSSGSNVTAFGSQSAGVLATAVTGVPSFVATSTLYGTALGGRVLGWDNTTGGIAWVATSTSGGGGWAGTSLTKGYFIVGDDSGTTQATSSVFVSSTGNFGVGTTSPYSLLSIGGNVVVGASAAGGTLGSLYLPALGTPAGTIIAVDPNGKIIATTTSAGGVTSVSAT